MPDKVIEQVWSLSQTGEATIQPRADFTDGIGRRIFQVRFDIAVTLFFGIEFRRILWQRFNPYFRMSVKIPVGLPTLVNRGSIPNQNQGSRHMALEMFEHSNDLRTLHAPSKMAFVDLAR